MPAVRPRFHLTPCSKFRSHLSFTVEIGGKPSEIEIGLIRQAAALKLREQVQAQIVAGAHVDAEDVVRLSSEYRRIVFEANRWDNE